jgi:hypothetical protein
MRRVSLACLALAGCNQILGNGNFSGPTDAPAADACTAGAACPPDAMPDGSPDASMVCQAMGMPPTTISGTVFMPNGTTPLPDVLVYVPMSTPSALPNGVACACAPATGGAVVSAVTDKNGHFTLTDPPTGASVPLVIQIGKWRRQITVPNVTACMDTAVAADQTRLPRNRNEGDIPRIAIVTGAADQLECLMLQVGIDQAEIATGGAPARIHLFQPPMGPGVTAYSGGQLQTQIQLFSSLMTYDDVMFSCPGQTPTVTAADVQQLQSWANAGGRLLLEHYESAWFGQGSPWASVAHFQPMANIPPTPTMAMIDQSFPKGTLLAGWLGAIGASSTGTIQVENARNTVQTADTSQVQVWAHLDPSVTMGLSGFQIFSFPTPLGAGPGQTCGQVVFSDMHETGTGAAVMAFPGECPQMPLDPQQDVLAFLFYDQQTCLQ